MPAGRPTDYTPELVAKAREYTGGKWKHQEYGQIPSHIGLAKYLKINRKTLYIWAKEEGKEEFCTILDEVMALQQLALIGNGLDGTFNSAITKLVLGKHGYHDKQDNTHADPDGKPLKTTLNIIYRDAPERD